MYLLASFFNVQNNEMVFEQFIQYDPIESWIKQPLEGLFSHIKVWLVGLIKLNYLMVPIPLMSTSWKGLLGRLDRIRHLMAPPHFVNTMEW